MFKRVLIANRGEIAVRVTRTLQQMGIAALAVYSDPDRGSLHVSSADEAYPLHGTTPTETYLRGDKILELAKAHGAEAIHPGYGFLSENDEFAQACAEAGIVFIGPKPEAIRTLGDKIVAKETLRKSGVPVVPGWSGEQEMVDDSIRAEARKIGYPVLIKAAAGGGGRGMRIVTGEEELSSAWDSARREAAGAFGDGRVFVEKYISRPRHEEFQIFGDQHGNAVHLFERDCSIQRRYQKIVEESPSPAMSAALRTRMGEAAVRVAQTFGYDNAGTVEFIVDDKGDFYFLEVNTRLQVEHPVTELITGLDLVKTQLMVAAGQKLPFIQEEVKQEGHALECRIYAEDPAHDFRPSIGTLVHFVPPIGPNIRVDSGVVQGAEVTPYYDAMLAKLVVWGRDRAEALSRMAWALRRFVVVGVTTNIEFLQALIDHPEFAAGRIHTHFLKDHEVGTHVTEIPSEAFFAATAALNSHSNDRRGDEGFGEGSASRNAGGPWDRIGAWRSV